MRIDQVAHELGCQLGVLMGVFDVHGLAVDFGQLVTELVAEVARVADLGHRANEVAVILIGVAPGHAVDAVIAADRAVRPALELAAEMGEDLERADVVGGLANRGGAPIRHQGRVQADLEVRRIHLIDHAQDVVMVLDDRAMILQAPA